MPKVDVDGSLAFSADRQAFALTSADGVGLYETATGRLLGVLSEKIERVGATAFKTKKPNLNLSKNSNRDSFN